MGVSYYFWGFVFSTLIVLGLLLPSQCSRYQEYKKRRRQKRIREERLQFLKDESSIRQLKKSILDHRMKKYRKSHSVH